MKKVKNILYRTRWIFYIGFIVMLIKFFGIYRFMVSNNSQRETSMVEGYKNMGRMDQLETELNATIESNQLAGNLLKKREEQFDAGDMYFYVEYITDLARIDTVALNKGLPTQNNMDWVGKAQELMNKSYKRTALTNEERHEAGLIYEAITGEESIIGAETPDWDISFDEINEKTDFSWSNTLNWFWRKYLKLFPLVLFIYLFWFLIDDRLSKFVRRNPVSLVLSIIGYPIVFFFLIRDLFSEKAREVLAETQYRRTKDKFFSLLSRDEIGRVKQFARSSKKLIAWKEELKNEGRVFNHSFTVVLVFTVLFGFFLSPSYAVVQSKTKDSDKRVEIYKTVKEKVSSCVKISEVSGVDQPVDLSPNLFAPPRDSVGKRIYLRFFHFFVRDEYISDIWHVPVFFSESIFVKKLFTKKTENEKYIFGNPFGLFFCT